MKCQTSPYRICVNRPLVGMGLSPSWLCAEEASCSSRDSGLVDILSCCNRSCIRIFFVVDFYVLSS